MNQHRSKLSSAKPSQKNLKHNSEEATTEGFKTLQPRTAFPHNEGSTSEMPNKPSPVYGNSTEGCKKLDNIVQSRMQKSIKKNKFKSPNKRDSLSMPSASSGHDTQFYCNDASKLEAPEIKNGKLIDYSGSSKPLQILQSDGNKTTWSCRNCLYANNAVHINACGKCKEVRFGFGSSDLRNAPSMSLERNQNGTHQETHKNDPVIDSTWTCTTCTLINNTNLLFCEACLAPKLQSLSISDCVTKQKGNIGNKQKKRNRKKRRQNQCVKSKVDTKDSSSSIQNGANKITHWICPLCTFDNSKSELICDMCKNMRCNDNTEQLSEEEIAEIQWNYIVSNCKIQNKLYIDESFPSVLASLYYSPAEHTNKNIKWRRLRNVVVDDDNEYSWVMFKDLLESLDVCQGDLGDCWLISALSVLVEREDLIRAVILTQQLCSQGVYQIRLCKDGNWILVTVDDIFPCDKDGYLLYAQVMRKQLWVPLIEKAFAKMYGCYESLICGSVIEGLSTLTGAPCESIFLQPLHSSDVIDADLIWSQIVSSRKSLFLMGILCGGNNIDIEESEFEKKGLHSEHVYSILDVLSISKYRVLQLRDPYGSTGACYTTNWDFRFLKLLPFREPESGVFWIDFEEVLKYFSCLGICKVRNGWFETRLSGTLYLSAFQQEVSCILLTVHEATEVDFMLHQNSQREVEISKRTLSDLCLILFKPKGNSSTTYNLITNSKRAIQGFVGCSKVLEPAQYIIMPLTFNQWHLKERPKTESKYVLAVHSSKKISAEYVTSQPQALADAVISLALTNGRCKKLLEHFNVYYLTTNFCGAAIVVENKYKNNWVHLKCNGEEEGSYNIVSTRGLKNTVDSIPPLHRQVVAVFTKFVESNVYFTAQQLDYRISKSSELCDWGSRGVSHIPDINYQTDGLHLPRIIQDC